MKATIRSFLMLALTYLALILPGWAAGGSNQIAVWDYVNGQIYYYNADGSTPAGLTSPQPSSAFYAAGATGKDMAQLMLCSVNYNNGSQDVLGVPVIDTGSTTSYADGGVNIGLWNPLANAGAGGLAKPVNYLQAANTTTGAYNGGLNAGKTGAGKISVNGTTSTVILFRQNAGQFFTNTDGSALDSNSNMWDNSGQDCGLVIFEYNIYLWRARGIEVYPGGYNGTDNYSAEIDLLHSSNSTNVLLIGDVEGTGKPDLVYVENPGDPHPGNLAYISDIATVSAGTLPITTSSPAFHETTLNYSSVAQPYAWDIGPVDKSGHAKVVYLDDSSKLHLVDLLANTDNVIVPNVPVPSGGGIQAPIAVGAFISNVESAGQWDLYQ